MTDTGMSRKIVGAAYPRHFNKPIALAMNENIQQVGLPTWSEDDQRFAKALQTLMGADEPQGLATELSGIGEPQANPISGGSDDIGDISWNVPTVTLRYPSNVRGLQGHHWSSAMAMATPIAHKGAIAEPRSSRLRCWICCSAIPCWMKRMPILTKYKLPRKLIRRSSGQTTARD